MPARDGNRGRGAGRGQTGSGSRSGGGGRETGARSSTAGQGRSGGGGGGSGQSQGGGRVGAGAQGTGAQRSGASASAQRSSGGGAGAAPGRSTTGGGARAGASPASAQASGSRIGGTAGGATAGAQGAARSQTADPSRRGAELGNVGGTPASLGASSGATGESAERPRDIDTAREGASGMGETARSVGGPAGLGGGAGAGGQVRSAAASGGGAAVGGRGQGRPQGLSPWFVGGENPFAMMRRMQEDLDRVFHAFGVPRFAAAVAPARELEELLARSPALTQAAQWSPQIEVFERGDSLVVRADLPGVKREDLEVNVENDVLTIRGQRRHEHRDMEGGYRRTERSYGTFFREIPLPDGVDPSQVEASYEDGVLEVVVPSPDDQPQGRRRVEIR